jgi:hypothetical protein
LFGIPYTVQYHSSIVWSGLGSKCVKNWTLGVSIPLPPACEAGALPSELNAHTLQQTQTRISNHTHISHTVSHTHRKRTQQHTITIQYNLTQITIQKMIIITNEYTDDYLVERETYQSTLRSSSDAHA